MSTPFNPWEEENEAKRESMRETLRQGLDSILREVPAAFSREDMKEFFAWSQMIGRAFDKNQQPVRTALLNTAIALLVNAYYRNLEVRDA